MVAATRVEGELAKNAAFKKIFNVSAKNASRISSQYLSTDLDKIASTRKQLRDALRSLKKNRASIKSVRDRNIQKALKLLGTSVPTILRDSGNVVGDAIRVLATVPRFALMRKSAKKVVIANVVNRPEFKSKVAPSIQRTRASASAHEKRCIAVLVLSILAAIIALIFAIVIDVVVVAVTVGISAPIVIAALICEELLFYIAIAISILDFLNC